MHLYQLLHVDDFPNFTGYAKYLLQNVIYSSLVPYIPEKKANDTIS